VTVDIRAASSQKSLETDYVRHRFTIRSGRDGAWSFSHEDIELVAKGKSKFKIVRTPRQFEFGPRYQFGGFFGGSARLNKVSELSEMASVMVFARQFNALEQHAPLRNVTRIRLSPESMRRPQAATEMGAMRKIVPGLSRISVEPFDRFLLLKFDQHQAGAEVATFSSAEMSEGALRALGILVAAQQMTKGELLIIEEPEVSMHVGAAQLLFDVLETASRKGAVLLTTHSADILDAASDEAILVCSYRAGVTRVGPLSSAQRDVVREGLFSIAELMRSEPLRIEGERPEAVAD
jgi:type I restriction enzyme M protein